MRNNVNVWKSRFVLFGMALTLSLPLQGPVLTAGAEASRSVAATIVASADVAVDIAAPAVSWDTKTSPTASEGNFTIKSSADGTQGRIAYYKFPVPAEYLAPEPGISYEFAFKLNAKWGSNTPQVPVPFDVYGLADDNWEETSRNWTNSSNHPADRVEVSGIGKSAFYIGTFTVNTGTNTVYSISTPDLNSFMAAHGGDGNVSFLAIDSQGLNKNVTLSSKETASTSILKPTLEVTRLTETPDEAPPSWPEGTRLTVTNYGKDFAQLTWTPAADNQAVTEYQVYANDALLGTVTGSTYYTAQGLTPSSVYTFRIEARDAAGLSSTGGPAVTKTTLSEDIVSYPVSEVEASSTDGNLPANTIDGNLTTRWSSFARDGEWIQYDLGNVQEIGYLGIAFHNGSSRTSRFDLEVSHDAINWTSVYTGSSSGLTTALEAFNFPDVQARYVRYIGHGNTSNLYNSLTEVQIYKPHPAGDMPVAVVPSFTPGPPAGTVPYTKAGFYHPDGTGYTPHIPNPVTGRTINVVDFGADREDSASDDRGALQAAIDAAQPGDEVYLPDGIYNLNSAASDGASNLLLKSGVNVRGESQQGTVLKTNFNLLNNSTVLKAVNQHDILVSNLLITSTWNGQYSNNHQVANPDKGGPQYGITISDFGSKASYRITIDSVTVEKFERMGVRISNSREITVRGSTFRNATDVAGGGAGYGVSIQGTAKTDRLGYDNDTLFNLVEHNRFEGPYLRHGTLLQFYAHNNLIRENTYTGTVLDSIDLHGEDEYLNEIHGNLISGVLTGAGIGVGNTGGTAPSNHDAAGPGNYIHHNRIENSREGIKVHMGSRDTRIEYNTIQNTVSVVDAKGIYLQNAPGTIVKSNVIRNNTAVDYTGIVLAEDLGDANAGSIGAGIPQKVQIFNNAITGNVNGIRIEAGTGIRVENNLLENSGVNYESYPGTDVIYVEPPIAAIPGEGVVIGQEAADVTKNQLADGGNGIQVLLNDELLEQAMLRLKAQESTVRKITLSVSDTVDAVQVKLPGRVLANAQKELPGLHIYIQTNTAGYELPVLALKDHLTELADGWYVTISMKKVPQTDGSGGEAGLSSNDAFLLVLPVLFNLSIESGGVVKEIESANQFITLSFTLGTPPAPKFVTGGILEPETGRYRLVPVLVKEENGAVTAVMKSKTNGTFAVLSKPVS
ncbi:discoidin domain-containing protein [Paenibacillus gansuensis]|uniref:Discoidin domain-containing protein n=1 Tax=Paenibacillus gansuensis TaxID=306542 RepID=A0ABW5PB07_9BACL